jgi:hypothetical protein
MWSHISKSWYLPAKANIMFEIWAFEFPKHLFPCCKSHDQFGHMFCPYSNIVCKGTRIFFCGSVNLNLSWESMSILIFTATRIEHEKWNGAIFLLQVHIYVFSSPFSEWLSSGHMICMYVVHVVVYWPWDYISRL